MKFLFVNCLILIAISYFSNNYIVTDQLINDHLSSIYDESKILTILDSRQKFSLFKYLVIPFVYLSKTIVISLWIYTGLLISATPNLKFKSIFSSVILPYSIFLIPSVIKIFWFSFQENYSLIDLQSFMPGSLLNLFDINNIESVYVYPLKVLNIWEVAFWFALAYELKGYFQEDFGKSFGTVMASYGSGLVIWIVFVVFLTLNFT
jgi:hypothetical protein